MSNNAPSQGPGAQGQQPQALIKVHQIQSMPHLDETAKQRYAVGIQRLYTILHDTPPDSDDHKQAYTKLLEASQKLRMQLRSYQDNLKQQQQQQQQQQGASQAGQQASGRPQSGGQSAGPQQQQQPQQQQGQPQQQPSSAPQTQHIPPQIMHHVQGFNFVCPPELVVGTPEANQYLANVKQSYLQALVKQEQARSAIGQVTKVVNERKAQGQDVPADIMAQKAQFEQSYNKSKAFVDEIRQKQALWKSQREQGQGASSQQVKTEGGGNAPNPAPTPQFQLQMPPQRQHSQGQSGAAPPVNPALDAARNQSNAGRTSQSPATSGPPQQQQAQTPAFSQQPPPTSGAPSMQIPQQQSRPQVNPQQAAHLNPVQQNSPHSQNPQGPPIPLTHQAAINNSNAQRSYSGQQQGGSQAPSASSYHGLGNREQMNNPKMPIPKTLSVVPPQPVNMGPARPTMGGPSNGVPGMMGQPVINKPAGFVMEGEARSVLTKSKLDELVRQVTGGGDSETLAPEVEEIMYQLADEFVDDVVTSACRLAKLRDSSTLDIRDLQLILERNYNIRIPGYASDEVRTVRKFHPAPGWTQKMNAVQAAKVMGGKTDI
ncbi:Transcription initiation factor TFIID subunit 12 [Coniosporium tulheliwenetii]|uniref:Transcription initiation factor TFIID subunit 12 n=1 Tax=Coniosporium tulheliwenetii TaxID=3383036 RepID=A0ACC2ZMQ9_9PEZI|nr:Transcription initiation factor TFIID subunit 12 [Cladosporium sp. JES 115]